MAALRFASEAPADVSVPPPPSIVLTFIPYGTETLHQLTWGSYNGHPTLEGVVLSGSETSRIGGHRSTRDTAGRRRTIYGVRATEVLAGECIRSAG